VEGFLENSGSTGINETTVSEVAQWNEQGVLAWLPDCKKLEKSSEQIKEAFIQYEIDGSTLLKLDSKALGDLGITGMVSCKLLGEVEKLKKVGSCSMNEQEVLAWLNDCKKLEKWLKQITEVFTQHEIDGSTLLKLDSKALEEVGITGIVSFKLLGEVDKLKIKV